MGSLIWIYTICIRPFGLQRYKVFYRKLGWITTSPIFWWKYQNLTCFSSTKFQLTCFYCCCFVFLFVNCFCFFFLFILFCFFKLYIYQPICIHIYNYTNLYLSWTFCFMSASMSDVISRSRYSESCSVACSKSFWFSWKTNKIYAICFLFVCFCCLFFCLLL